MINGKLYINCYNCGKNKLDISKIYDVDEYVVYCEKCGGYTVIEKDEYGCVIVSGRKIGNKYYNLYEEIGYIGEDL